MTVGECFSKPTVVYLLKGSVYSLQHQGIHIGYVWHTLQLCVCELEHVWVYCGVCTNRPAVMYTCVSRLRALFVQE